MSRFGLRSSDSLKLLDEKNIRRKASSSASTLSNRNTQLKDSKFIPNVSSKDENLIDDIKIESEDLEKVSDICTRFEKNNPECDEVGNEDEDEDNDNDNYDDEDDDDYKHQSSSCKESLVCSLPLDRINEIIQKLNLNNSKIEHKKENDEIIVDETLDNDYDEDDDTNISKQISSNVKNLCLYCDRKFSSHKMQLKHVDKFHCLQQDRRCSGRNAQINQQQQSQVVSRKRKSVIETQNFPGCNFCQKSKGQSQPVILPATELSSLFIHLTDCHTDRYFGCKTCSIRFQNLTKLSKHMEMVHKSLSFAFDESSSKSKDNDTDSIVSIDKLTIGERSKLSVKRQQRSQKSLNSCIAVNSSSQCSTAMAPNTSVIGAEEPILSRLGLTQNRLPNNRKGVRLRREKLIPELLLKSEQNHTSSTNFIFGQTTSMSASSTSTTTCSPKLRGKSIKVSSGFSTDTTSDVIFRVPTRNDILSCVFDDNFYKEVVPNVRNNLLFHLDGKIMGNSMQQLDSNVVRQAHQPQIRSTLVKSPIVVTTVNSEIHAATSLAAITAFPTLLTAEQFGGDATTSKIRRPHTKNSWKWKWDSVKKFKLINEGGKIVKKMKHPMLGLRDLSKLDMWTQLTMRQKHEFQQIQKTINSIGETPWHSETSITVASAVSEISSDPSREEKQRLNDQLAYILDMRLLPHIILEQNEQAIIKAENDEFGIAPSTQIPGEDCAENIMAQTFADERFLSMLNLLPKNDSENHRTKLVLSGEWARPRCYLCICCGSKFEKLKSLEEHKMFRHSQILSTHYEVVGRELLNGNLLQHLFIPKKALSRYGNEIDNNLIYSGAARRLFWHKNETLIREITNNEESSDSLQSVLNSCVTNTSSLKNSSSSTEDCCDIDTKMSATTALIGNAAIVSPTHSIHSCSSSSSTGIKRQFKIRTSSGLLPINNLNINCSSITNNSNNLGTSCSKCGRKCNGILDLYRHMLDCSGDYIWSLAKKRKYRYYCGSKKRRPCNKHSILELKKNKSKTVVKNLSISNENTNEEGALTTTSFTKTKTSPRSRPSDAESIKKMLENLPPKRICKKIFPTLSKTKRSMKNIKPKLLAKHKIYNNLRKTRVRQMSQAAKILSKTKSQLKKPKKMTTRSSKITKKINKKKKNIKMLMKTNTVANASENVNTNKESIENSQEEVTDEVDSSNIKIENKNSVDPSTNQTSAFLKNSENNSNDPLVKCSDLLENLDKPKEVSHVEIPINTSETIDKIKTNTCNTTDMESNTSSVHKMISTEILTKEITQFIKVNASASSTPVSLDNNERSVQINNKNVKRSKRISDCIAMLTGKLEEKLKTEQKMSLPCSQEKIVPPVTYLKTLNECTSQILPQTVQCLQPIMVHKSAEIVDADTSPLKKTPKRKTISRKIVKTDVSERNVLPVATPNINNKNFDNLKTEKPPQIITTTKDRPMPVTLNLVNKQNLVTQQPEATTSCIQKEKQKSNNFIPTTIPTMPPPVVPSNTPVMLPKVPLYIPLENLRQPLPTSRVTPLPIPMPLPIPVPVPIPIENVAQASPGAISSNMAMLTAPVIPIISSVPAHLAAPPALQLTVSTFNATNTAVEPLNLSNSSKNLPKQSQDLSCTNNQRGSGGIPARRQTICGFEARNFAVFDEMEPLDLSKKPRTEKIAVSAPIPPRNIEMAPLLLPAQSSLGTPNEPSVLTLQSLNADALINKPFYSNLDLLRIPQVRNPVVGQVNVTPIETVQPTAVISTTAAVQQPTKAVSKKRNKLLNMQSAIHCNITPAVGNSVEVSVIGSVSTANKASNAKDLPNISISKKETSGKNKPTLRMDEEVINHIDDAINSVINAVKASLDNEEAQKAQEMILLQNHNPLHNTVSLKTTDDLNAAKESVSEFHFLTSARRNMRSKTLDCRPPPLKTNTKNSTFIPTNIDIVLDVNTVTTTTAIDTAKPHSCQNNENIRYNDAKIPSTEETTAIAICDRLENQIESKKATVKEAETKNESVLEKELESKLLEACTEYDFSKKNKTKIEETSLENPLTINPNKNVETKASNEQIIATVDHIEDKEYRNGNSVAKSNLTLDLEQVSNNNNTSSGFHSSAQSDQQTSVMSTTASALSVSIPGNDIKKKQRRRRKNELAAIVADQLLESFKLDKARRDNLKKLENLAYEKSEDLLLTGMLLMSSTKRNVASSSNNANTMMEKIENIKRSTKCQRINQSNEVPKQSDIISTPTCENFSLEKPLEYEDPLEVNDSIDNKKNNKRRQYRRRGKTLDNENISKLKSSLESFSIDIERQLTEYEAKNVNVFKNVTRESSRQASTLKNPNSTNINKPSIILRPSILSAKIESGGTQETSHTPAKSITSDGNKSIISSRDPRLNKNIHKEGEKNNDVSALTVEKETLITQKNNTGPEDIGDLDEDNYLTEIAKNVNEKIMSTENEEFAFKDDGFEMANDLGIDDSNSKFSRPPTSMSVHSAPNFNDDRSNFGSICDENTNTEVMDMDLDDEMSVYTSYSQDLGRGCGRRRRRRRSILLTRKPKKRTLSRDLSADKIECILCKKVFYSANSLSKHNMTLAHVSKVSEQEYLLSKSQSNVPDLSTSENLKSITSLGPYARRSTRRSTISEPPMQTGCEMVSPSPITSTQNVVRPAVPPPLTNDQTQRNQVLSKSTIHNSPEAHSIFQESLKQTEAIDKKVSKSVLKPIQKDPISDSDYHNTVNPIYNGNSRLNLNPDERLFFECCNILKSAETPRINNTIAVTEECNISTNYTYNYNNQEKSTPHSNIIVESTALRSPNIHGNQSHLPVAHSTSNNLNASNHHPIPEQQTLFRDPQFINQPCCFNKPQIVDNRNARSPTYSGISHLSAVTNTTSRFKTKAAMKGYENVNVDLNQQQESKSRTICKLTELAEIALGNEEKPNSHDFSPIQSSLSPPQVPSSHLLPTHQPLKVNLTESIRSKALVTPEYVTSMATENLGECNVQLPTRNERTKNNETRSSTSSKTIMHSSIIKAAVEEHQKPQTNNKIIIPDRPFKNIGLEEKETITFQKPKAPAVNLLTEDNNSVSTGSFSDRDDYDFGSLSCDDEVSVRESNDRNEKNNSTDSSSGSSRATAKTFENKSLIMGRIFKNASTKTAIKSCVNTVKVKSIGIQKDQTPVPKADLNQLFDELRGNSGVDEVANEKMCNPSFAENMAATCSVSPNIRTNHKQNQQQRENIKSIIPAASPPAVVSSTTATPSYNVRKTKPRVTRTKANVDGKNRKDINKLQSELGMSPDEIKKLIDEGQRKSKRRCATNRPKKLIEMWSSDEYEEFLSTKDIIALIEEKEQQEKRKKRKTSVNNPSNVIETVKEKEVVADVTSSTKETKRRNTRRMSMVVDTPQILLDHDELLSSKSTKNKRAKYKKEEPVSTTANFTNACELAINQGFENRLSGKGKGKKGKKAEASTTFPILLTDNNNDTRKKRSNNINSNNTNKNKPIQKAKKTTMTNTKETSRAKYKRGQYIEEDESNEEVYSKNCPNDDDDDDFLISELKTKQSSKTRSNKTTKTQKIKAAASAPIVTTMANSKASKTSAVTQQVSNKKRGSNNNSNNNGPGCSNPKGQQNTLSSGKPKRKNQSNQSPPRRKRLATEKLYYWSSSSDEDFGRINNNKGSNPQPDTYEIGGEQYQKHGWIVGDSHKKLVTLLAIAKGNKKIDSNSGVKKNSAKKRN